MRDTFFSSDHEKGQERERGEEGRETHVLVRASRKLLINFETKLCMHDWPTKKSLDRRLLRTAFGFSGVM